MPEDRAPRILVVDDEPQILRVVAAYLDKEGFTVHTAVSGEDALDKFRRRPYDVVVLDLMLPGISGERVCQDLRKVSDVPVIMLTAKGSEEERIRGLDIGADDYLVKPFSPRELVARVRALLRRSGRERAVLAEVLELDQGRVVMDLARRAATRAGRPLELTPTEFDLLAVLAGSPGRVFPRRQLVDLVLGYDYEGFDDTIYAHIKNLRKKIEDDPAKPRLIQTVYGVGYRFRGGDGVE